MKGEEKIMMNIRKMLPARLLFTASAVAAALLAPPTVSGQNEKENFTGFAIQHEQRAGHGDRGLHD